MGATTGYITLPIDSRRCPATRFLRGESCVGALPKYRRAKRRSDAFLRRAL